MRRMLLACAACVLATCLPASAQEDIGFKPVPSRAITAARFADEEISSLIATLDSLLDREKDPAKWESAARIHLWRFQNRLDRGIITPAQAARILAHFDDLAKKHADAGPGGSHRLSEVRRTGTPPDRAAMTRA